MIIATVYENDNQELIVAEQEFGTWEEARQYAEEQSEIDERFVEVGDENDEDMENVEIYCKDW